MLLHSLYVYAQDVLLVLTLLSVFFCVGYSLAYCVFKETFLSLEKTLTECILVGFVGLFFYIKVAFLLGLLGFFYLELLFIITVLAVLPLYFIRDEISVLRLSSINYGHLFLLLLTLLLGLRSYFSFFGSDDLSYHLPYARSFLENHHITVEEHLIYPLHALDANLMFSMILMIGDEFFLRLFNIFTLSILAILIYDYLCQKMSPWLALLAPLIILSSTFILFLSLVIYVDFAFSLFLTVSFISFLIWYEKRDNDQAIIYLSVVALGVAAAASTKYFGLMYGFMVFLILLFCSERKIKDACVFLSICGLFGSAWYLRNIFISGNPFHPFLSNIFGYYLWTSEDLAFNLRELESHGLGKNIFFYIKKFILNAVFPLVSIFISLPIFLILWFNKHRSMFVKLNIVLSLFCVMYFIFWYQTARIDRYLLPILGLSSISFILTIQQIFGTYRYFKSVTITICLLSASFSLVKMWQENVPLFLRYPVSQYHSNMMAQVSAYPLMQQANQLKLSEDRIYQIGFSDRAYYYKGVAAGHWMGAARWSNIAIREGWELTLKPADKILKYLQDNRYYALAISKAIKMDPQDLSRLFNIVYEDKDGFIALPKNQELSQ